MRITIIGTGYVGLVSGLCFAEFGFKTVCVDKDQSRLKNISEGISPFYEPGLDDLIKKHVHSTKLLSLSSNFSKEVKKSDIIFITVGTPARRLIDDADLTSIYDVARKIAENIENYSVIVTKSTVPVGTTRKIKEIISKTVSSEKFDVVANPEFLREGSAIDDFMRPDRVVIGTDSKKSEEIIKEIYRPLYLAETPIVSTSIETAEVIKYASNSFLATKISFINEVADLCEIVNANVQDVAKAMGLDKRIGPKFLNAGPGYGGSCFPKDVKAFAATAKKLDLDLSIINAVHRSNESRPIRIASKISQYYNDNIKNITLTVLGLSFKPNTDDIRDSTSLIIIKELLKKGIQLKVYDPKAMQNAKKQISEILVCQDPYEACKESSGLIIATEWNEFRALDLIKIKSLLSRAVIFDLRNIYNSKEILKLGIEYFGIGK